MTATPDTPATPKAPTPSEEATPDGPPTEAQGEDHGEERSEELGGPQGPEPTRFGDWERNGRCSDF